MSRIMLEEITAQSIGTIKALCIHMHRNLFSHHGNEFPCHNLFGRPLVSHPHILGLFGMLDSESGLNSPSQQQIHHCSVCLRLILRENNQPKDF